MMEFKCPDCGEAVEVDDRFAGQRGRCPGCLHVVTIPRTSAADREPPGSPGPSAFGPDLSGRRPRPMKVPDSVQAVDLDDQPPPQPVPTVGPVSAVTAMILAPVPCVSVVGIIFGGIAWARARRARQGRRLRLAIAATVLAIVTTAAQVVFGVAVFVAATQVSVATGGKEQCQEVLYYLGGNLNAEASTDGKYPDKMTSHTSGRYGYSLGEHCPASESKSKYGYIGGLKYDGGAGTIVLYDPEPAHGYRTWLKSCPDGRNVFRMNGTVDFLTEEQFQKEMVGQSARLGQPWPQ